MTKKRQMELLLKCVSILNTTKLWNNPGPSYYWNLVKYAHKRGWLYVGFDNDEIDTVLITYRVKEVTDSSLETLPEKDEGDTLYVLIAVSKSEDKFKLSKLKRYILSINPDVKKVALHHRGDQNKLRIYEVNCGKTIEA